MILIHIIIKYISITL